MKRVHALIAPSRLAGGTALALGAHLHTRPLALCLVAALAGHAGVSDAVPHAVAHIPLPGMAMPSAPTHATAQTWTVKNCNNSGTDSLRDLIENPMNAKSGDTVDLSELPVRCGMTASVITLGSEIAIAQDDLTLQGPTRGSVSISAAGISRVFHHKGAGTLALNALTISDGYYHASENAYGGCIESDSGNLFLAHAVVTHCTIVSTKLANGGGVSAYAGNVTLIASQISGNKASGGISGWGGGVYSRGATGAWYSSITGNMTEDSPTYYGKGGGIDAAGGATLIAATIDNNTGGYGGGLAVSVAGATTVWNSTISNNTARSNGSAIFAGVLQPLLIANSTIAFNWSSASDTAAIHFQDPNANTTLTLDSSIIANNSAGSDHVPADIYVVPGHGLLAGADNLVVASNVSDPTVITVSADPKLGPLKFNGGRTPTHMLLPGSPALSKGNVNGLPPSITNEQRGTAYPRTTGPSANVDIGAVQFDTIFADSFDAFF